MTLRKTNTTATGATQRAIHLPDNLRLAVVKAHFENALLTKPVLLTKLKLLRDLMFVLEPIYHL